MGNHIGSISRKNREKNKIVFIQGLGDAGKTTVLYKLKLGGNVHEIDITNFMFGTNVEMIEHNNVSISAWDFGGRVKGRPLERYYYKHAKAIIFVIDSADRERMGEIKEGMARMMGENELRNCPFVILANKQDLSNAMTVQEVEEKIDLTNIAGKRRWNIFPTSAITGAGLHEALDWLTEQYSNGKTKQKEQKNSEDAVDFEVSLLKKATAKLKSLLFE